MPTTVNKHISGHSDGGAALRVVQTFTSQPVTVSGCDTPQALEREIIRMQTFLATQNASTPSGKKFDPAKINRAIDHQLLGAKLMELQAAANNT